MNANETELQSLSTVELVRRALQETRLLARTEIEHAKLELKSELRAAKLAGILFGAALAFVLCGLSVLFVALALALPVAPPVGALIVGVVLCLLAAGCAVWGVSRIPKKPLPVSQERLKVDLTLARRELAS